MADDLVERLRWWKGEIGEILEAADHIEKLQDIIARIQYTNLRRDMNLKNRTIEIEKLCGGKNEQ
jgi:hypothetical protein